MHALPLSGNTSALRASTSVHITGMNRELWEEKEYEQGIFQVSNPIDSIKPGRTSLKTHLLKYQNWGTFAGYEVQNIFTALGSTISSLYGCVLLR